MSCYAVLKQIRLPDSTLKHCC